MAIYRHSHMSEVGARIKEAATKVGGLNKLAALIDMPRRTLGDKLSGRSEPELSLIVKVARVTNVRLEWLADNEGPRDKQSDLPDPSFETFEQLLEVLGKIVVREHKEAGFTLPSEKVAPEAGVLYRELFGMVRNVADQRTVEAMLPLLAENLRNRLRSASAEPGTGKREAS